jgi:glycosyltransferase 2 family protein
MSKRFWWSIGKVVLAAAILISVGWRFYRDLRDEPLHELTLRWEWLVLSAALYLLALGTSARFWFRLLLYFGQRPGALATIRAYYIGHLGKYLPGKALALLMRGALVRGPEVRLSIAILTAFLEVLTTMAAGALCAAVLFSVEAPRAAGLPYHPVLVGVVLLGLCSLPLLPGVFNWLAGRLARRFSVVESLQLPRLRTVVMGQGLLITGVGWGLLGVSLWALVQGVLSETQPLTPDAWARYTAMMALAYVAGFLAIIMPGGVGVREFVLTTFLAPELATTGEPRALAAVAVLLLRVVWTAAELVLAAVVYWLPGGKINAVPLTPASGDA